MKEKLTIKQRIDRIVLFVMWFATVKSNRRTWELVKKGSEKHEHKYTITDVYIYNGKAYPVKKCEHEGCMMMEPQD